MRLIGLAAAVIMICSCMPMRRVKAPPPPGPTPVRIPDQVANVEPAPPPTNLPAPPPITAGTAATKTASAKAIGIPPTPTAAPPKPAEEKKATVKKAAAPPPVVATAQAAPEEHSSEPPQFRLGELRTPEEKEKLLRQTEQMIAQCAAALATVEGKTLTQVQTELANRVRTFSQQARDVMDKDPAEARNFAAKGRTFAEALLAELH